MGPLSIQYIRRNILNPAFIPSLSTSTIYYRRTRASDPVLPSLSIHLSSSLRYFSQTGFVYSASSTDSKATSSSSACSPSTGTCTSCEIPCWSCGSCINKASLVCGTCAYIQPLKTDANYFAVLQM